MIEWKTAPIQKTPSSETRSCLDYMNEVEKGE